MSDIDPRVPLEDDDLVIDPSEDVDDLDDEAPMPPFVEDTGDDEGGQE